MPVERPGSKKQYGGPSEEEPPYPDFLEKLGERLSPTQAAIGMAGFPVLRMPDGTNFRPSIPTVDQ